MKQYKVYFCETLRGTGELYSSDYIGIFSTDLEDDEVNDILSKLDRDSVRDVQFFSSNDEIFCWRHYGL